MFYYLNGTVSALEENLAVVDCGGVGFACHTTAFTIASLKIGERHMLYTHCNIREDAFDIYGFATRQEVDCFRSLIGVSGVGPKAALSILSALTPEQLTLAVMSGDEKALTAANGIGKKMAQRVILELKDKMGVQQISGYSAAAPSVVPSAGNKSAEAAAALATLGYSNSEIGVALRGIDVEHLPVEDIVRQALRAMIAK